MNMQLFQTMLQMAGQYPPLLQQWDLLGMIFYWLKLEGATWIDDFKLAPATSQTLPAQAATTAQQPNVSQTIPPQQ